jgi:hypothetical protein
VRANPECRWVSFTDTDEFIHVGVPDAPSTSIQHVLDEQPPSCGGIQLQMVTMRSGPLMKKPPGAVTRNYDCRERNGNIKSIVRPDKIHPGLFNAVHHYAYRAGFNPTRFFIDASNHSASGPYIYHFQTQAWEVHVRKYLRRASPATTGFKADGMNRTELMKRPTQKWLDYTSKQCPRRDTATARTLLGIVHFPREAQRGGGDGDGDKGSEGGGDSGRDGGGRRDGADGDGDGGGGGGGGGAIISGTAGLGSGLHWAWSSLLRSPSHVSAVVPWRLVLGGSSGDVDAATHDNVSLQLVFHHTRDPLKAIAALVAMPEERWQAASAPVWRRNKTATSDDMSSLSSSTSSVSSPPSAPLSLSLERNSQNVDSDDARRGFRRRRLAEALSHWVTWNLVLELVSSARYAVESTDVRSLCRLVVNRTCAESARRNSNSNNNNNNSNNNNNNNNNNSSNSNNNNNNNNNNNSNHTATTNNNSSSSAHLRVGDGCADAATAACDSVQDGNTFEPPRRRPHSDSHSQSEVTWSELRSVDPYMASLAADMSYRYGYCATNSCT